MDRLSETWSAIAGGHGWEFLVMRSTTVFSLVTGFAAGYFSRMKENEAKLIKELTERKLPEPTFSTMLSKKLFAANLKSGLRVGLRLAVVPISLSAITLSALSYRNDVHPLDLGLLYGMAGGAYALRAGVKRAAVVSAASAGFGVFTGFILILILNLNGITISEVRRQLTSEYRSKVEYKEMMDAMREKDTEYRRTLIEQELEKMKAKKRQKE